MRAQAEQFGQGPEDSKFGGVDDAAKMALNAEISDGTNGTHKDVLVALGQTGVDGFVAAEKALPRVVDGMNDTAANADIDAYRAQRGRAMRQQRKAA